MLQKYGERCGVRDRCNPGINEAGLLPRPTKCARELDIQESSTRLQAINCSIMRESQSSLSFGDVLRGKRKLLLEEGAQPAATCGCKDNRAADESKVNQDASFRLLSSPLSVLGVSIHSCSPCTLSISS